MCRDVGGRGGAAGGPEGDADSDRGDRRESEPEAPQGGDRVGGIRAGTGGDTEDSWDGWGGDGGAKNPWVRVRRSDAYHSAKRFVHAVSSVGIGEMSRESLGGGVGEDGELDEGTRLRTAFPEKGVDKVGPSFEVPQHR